MSIYFVPFIGGEEGGGRPGEKGVGGVREAGEEGAGSGIPKVVEGKNYAIFRNISQPNKCKEAGANKYRAGTGIKGYGKREVYTPLFPPPSTLYPYSVTVSCIKC